MATTFARSPGSRRSPSSATPSSSPPLLTKTVPSRSSAASRTPLNASLPRRQSLKVPPSPQLNGEHRETRESLSISLKLETERNEQLLLQLQIKDHTINSLTSENANLSSALGAAESRLNELYADQSRVEDEMAARIEVVEKLREQVRELEREKRDLQRRYNDQTSTFEAERQAFYDNEQHLKSRIQSLTQSRKVAEVAFPVPEEDSEVEQDDDEDYRSHDALHVPKQEPRDPESEPAEMTSLRLELSTLSTSYASLQSTLVLLQTQLADLKRVNCELQEENESYMILLREKTLSGQYDVSKQVPGAQSIESNEECTDDDTDADDSVDVGSVRSISRSTLDRVDETPEYHLEHDLDGLHARDPESSSFAGRPRHPPRHSRKRGVSESPRGESLAGLPITGPGLDLAAELGRAENKDILSEGNIFDSSDRPADDVKGKKGKKKTEKPGNSPGLEPSASSNDVEALRTEVKALKDANKALSLYASKIIDRIIAQEGFEHVLAIDYQAQTSPTSPLPTAVPIAQRSPVKPQKSRPQSIMAGNPSNAMESFRFGGSPQTAVPKQVHAPAPKTNRRSLSFDWKTFSFSGVDKKAENPSLRPLTLKPGSTPLTGARKLDTVEDENDRRERERLNATMKLMGITKTPASSLLPTPSMQKSVSSPASSSVPTATQSRFSWFRSRSTPANSDSSSIASAQSATRDDPRGAADLTSEALAQAEAEENLAALDAHERALSAEIAKGASGGYTEISRFGDYRSRRSRRSGGSGSTVWSAGMGKGDEEWNAS